MLRFWGLAVGCWHGVHVVNDENSTDETHEHRKFEAFVGRDQSHGLVRGALFTKAALILKHKKPCVVKKGLHLKLWKLDFKKACVKFLAHAQVHPS